VPPAFLLELLGRRSSGAPNIADADSATSVALASAILERLGVNRESNLDPQSWAGARERR
jgi:hypothetical protein